MNTFDVKLQESVPAEILTLARHVDDALDAKALEKALRLEIPYTIYNVPYFAYDYDKLVHEALVNYKRFLIVKLAAEANGCLATSPSALVDCVWHAHILCMKDYATFCKKLSENGVENVDVLLKHSPATMEDADADERYKETRRHVESLFVVATNADDVYCAAQWDDDLLQVLMKNNVKCSSNDDDDDDDDDVNNAKIANGGSEKVFSYSEAYEKSTATDATAAASASDQPKKRARLANNGMQVFCKTLTGKTITLGVTSETTVLEFKQQLVERGESSCVDQIRLLFAGAQLEDVCTLEECRVHKESTLHMVQRLRGC